MKLIKKRIPTILCALVLLLGGLLPAWASSANTTVYLLAANDKFCDLAGGFLPVAVDGTIYVPYTVFDKDATGVDLGVYYGLKQEQGTILSLYSINGHLTFRVSMGLCEDGQGNPMDFRALPRHGIPYVPAAAVCAFFGLQYSFLPTTDRGTLIRITSSPNTLSDALFLASARSSMQERYNNILQAREPTPSATPTPDVSVPPTAQPTVPAGRPDRSNIRVYLAVNASESESNLTTHFPVGVQALFLFTLDSLVSRADQVRSAVAAGHSIGLIVEGDLAQARAQLDQGNRLLSHIARVSTHIVSAPAELQDQLAQEGWRCWRGHYPGGTSTTVLSYLDARQSTTRLELPATPAALSRVLTTLRQDGYTLRQPVETDL